MTDMQAIFDEIAALAKQIRDPRPGPKWFTAQEYALSQNIKYDKARDDLNALAEANKASKAKRGAQWFYFFGQADEIEPER